MMESIHQTSIRATKTK